MNFVIAQLEGLRDAWLEDAAGTEEFLAGRKLSAYQLNGVIEAIKASHAHTAPALQRKRGVFASAEPKR